MQKYKTYLILAAICLFIGYCSGLLSSRGQLQAVRIRAESVANDAKQLREQLQSSQKQLADLKKSIRTAGKTASNAANTANDIKKSNQSAGESVNDAIGKIESSGNLFRDAAEILRGVSKRGRVKD